MSFYHLVAPMKIDVDMPVPTGMKELVCLNGIFC